MKSRKPNHTCDHCGKGHYIRPHQLEINHGKAYCSLSCFGKANRKNQTTCSVCGVDIDGSRRTKTCSRTCSNKSRFGMTYNKGENKRPLKCKVTSAKMVRQRLIEIRGEPKCERCGYDKYNDVVVIHHIVERSKGGTDDLDNLEFLCPTCHSEEHYLRRTE